MVLSARVLAALLAIVLCAGTARAAAPPGTSFGSAATAHAVAPGTASGSAATAHAVAPETSSGSAATAHAVAPPGTPSGSAAKAASASAEIDADALFAEAGKAYDAGDFERAHALYAQVFAARPTYETAAMLAQTEIKLDRPCEADAHLAFALARFPFGVAADRRARIERARAAVKKKIGTVRLVVSPADAAVHVDYVAVPATARSESGTFCAQAGDRTLFLSRAGYAVERRHVTVEAGAEVLVEAELRPLGAPAASASSGAPSNGDPPPPPARPRDPAVPIAFAALSLGLAGVVAGAVLMPLSRARGDDADRLSLQLKTEGGRTACAPRSDFASRCAELRGLRTDAAAFGNAGLSSLLAGAALGAAAGTFLVFRTSNNEERPGGPRVTVGVGPAGAGIALEGAF